MPQFDPRNDYKLKYPEGDDQGDVIDCANYDSIDRSQIGKLSKLNRSFQIVYLFRLFLFNTFFPLLNLQILSDIRRKWCRH